MEIDKRMLWHQAEHAALRSAICAMLECWPRERAAELGAVLKHLHASQIEAAAKPFADDLQALAAIEAAFDRSIGEFHDALHRTRKP